MRIEAGTFEQLPDQELVLLARNDRGAMESLVKRYTGAVWHQVRQFQGISEPEDLAQEGLFGSDFCGMSV